MSKSKTKAPAGEQARNGAGPGPIAIDPAQYTAPVVLNLAEVDFLGQVLGNIPVQATVDGFEAMARGQQVPEALAMVRSIRGKLAGARQLIERKLPTPGNRARR